MQLQNNYYYFKNAISSENCQKIINLGLEQINNKKNIGENVYGTTHGKLHKTEDVNENRIPIGENVREQFTEKNNYYVRDSKVAWLNEQWLYDLFNPFISTANNNAGWKWDINYAESFQFTVYEPGGFYGYHADGQSDHFGKYKRYIQGITGNADENDYPNGYVRNQNFVGKVRKISMTVNLNAENDYEGGNLKFDFGPHSDNRYIECTEIRPQGSIIVFPSFLYHCVTPVTRGTRYSLVLWALGEPWK